MNYYIYIDGFIGQSDFFTEGFSAKTLREKLASAPTGVDELTVHINSGNEPARKHTASELVVRFIAYAHFHVC